MEKEEKIAVIAKKFIIQLVSLFVFIELISIVFAPEIASLSQNAWGEAIRLTGFLALGWYWARIWDYVANKVRNLRS